VHRDQPEYSLPHLAESIDAELRLCDVANLQVPSITGLASLHEATTQQLAFCGSKKFLSEILSSQAAAIIISPALFDRFLSDTVQSNTVQNQTDYSELKQNFLLVANPELSFSVLTQLFSTYPPASLHIHSSAVVHETAIIGKQVSIEPNAVIQQGAVIADNCVIGAGSVVGAYAQIGENTRLFSNVNVYHDVEIGADCIIHAGAALGSDGFGFVPGTSGLEKLYQLGSLIVGDRVEIGANCTIDRGALSDTIIANGVKMDNQVHIAHNVSIGENTAIAGCVGIAGSTKIGANCQFGGQTGINGHIMICDNVVVTGQGLVAQSISEPGVYSSGIPASKNSNWRRNASRFHQLNDMARTIKKIESKLANNQNKE